MFSSKPGQSCGQSQLATAAIAIAMAVLILESGSCSPAGRAARICAFSSLLVSADGGTNSEDNSNGCCLATAADMRKGVTVR